MSNDSELKPLLNVPMRAYKEAGLEGVANDVCKHIPPEYVLSLCFENGAASVQLGKDAEGFIDLPDSADKTLLEQLNDAVCVAMCSAK